MTGLRALLRNSPPGVWYRRWRDARADARLERLSEMESHRVRLRVAGMALELKKYLAQNRYEAAEIVACRELLRADDSVLEIGAAIGFVGIYCQKYLGIQRYTSVEANPATAEQLRQNYALNGLTPTVLEVALAEADGEIEFHIGPLFWADSAVAKPAGGKAIRVKAATLETLLAAAATPPTALVIDVEGGELALRGRALPPSIRTLIIELHPDFIGEPAVDELCQGWQAQGFARAGIHGSVHIFNRPAASR